MDIGVVSLAVSVSVGILQLLGYLHSRTLSKEASTDKFAKASNVSSELDNIRDHVIRIDHKMEDYGAKISSIQIQNGICENNHIHTAESIKEQIKMLERIDDRL